VLLEDVGKFFLAYVVCHIAEGETRTVQFRALDQLNYFDTVDGLGWVGSLFSKVSPLTLFSGGYRRVSGIDQSRSRCRFYRYAPKRC